MIKYVIKAKLSDSRLSSTFIKTRNVMRAVDLDEPSIWETISTFTSVTPITTEQVDKITAIVLKHCNGEYLEVHVEEIQ